MWAALKLWIIALAWAVHIDTYIKLLKYSWHIPWRVQYILWFLVLVLLIGYFLVFVIFSELHMMLIINGPHSHTQLHTRTHMHMCIICSYYSHVQGYYLVVMKNERTIQRKELKRSMGRKPWKVMERWVSSSIWANLSTKH